MDEGARKLRRIDSFRDTFLEDDGTKL